MPPATNTHFPERDVSVRPLLAEILRVGNAHESDTQEKFVALRQAFWLAAKTAYVNGAARHQHADVRDFPAWFRRVSPIDQYKLVLLAVYGRRERELSIKPNNGKALQKASRAFNLTTTELFLVFGSKVCGQVRTLDKLCSLVNARNWTRTAPEVVISSLWDIVLREGGHETSPPLPTARQVTALVSQLHEGNKVPTGSKRPGPAGNPATQRPSKRTRLSDPSNLSSTFLSNPSSSSTFAAASAVQPGTDTTSTFLSNPSPAAPFRATSAPADYTSSAFITDPSFLSSLLGSHDTTTPNDAGEGSSSAMPAEVQLDIPEEEEEEVDDPEWARRRSGGTLPLDTPSFLEMPGNDDDYDEEVEDLVERWRRWVDFGVELDQPALGAVSKEAYHLMIAMRSTGTALSRLLAEKTRDKGKGKAPARR